MNLTYWLCTNLIGVQGANTSIEQIYSEISNFSEFKHDKSLLLYLTLLLFPSAKKSTVKCVESGKTIKSIKNIVFLKYAETHKIEFSQICEHIPKTWFVVEFSGCTLVLGQFLHVKFNGRNSVLQLTINNVGCIILKIDNKQVDCNFFYIPNEISFDTRSLSALFHSTQVIKPCHGYKLDVQVENIFHGDSKGIMETCCLGDMSFTTIRNAECLGYSPIHSKIQACKKCEKYYRNKVYHYRHKNEENKENVSPSCDEIIQQLKDSAPNLTENQLSLIRCQIKSSSVEKKCMRWEKDIICMALTLYNRNPSAYRDITSNKWLNLPSESLLGRYKNAIQQGPGIITDMMLWMKKEAESQNVSSVGYYGGIVLDEMAIQEDLQIVNTKNETKLIGLCDSGGIANTMYTISHGSLKTDLANHVLQYVFNGLTGFRWPFANFPNTQANPSEIFLTFWSCIYALFQSDLMQFTVVLMAQLIIGHSSKCILSIKIHFMKKWLQNGIKTLPKT